MMTDMLTWIAGSLVVWPVVVALLVWAIPREWNWLGRSLVLLPMPIAGILLVDWLLQGKGLEVSMVDTSSTGLDAGTIVAYLTLITIAITAILALYLGLRAFKAEEKLASLVGVALLTAFPALLLAGWTEFNHDHGEVLFRLDNLTAWFLLLAAFVAPFILHHSMTTDVKHPAGGRFVPVLLAIFTAAFSLAVLAGDTPTLVLGWELTTLCCVLLIRHGGGHCEAIQAEFNSGVALLFTAVPAIGLLGLGEMGGEMANFDSLATWTLVGVVVASVAKAGLPPFHFWLPRAMVARSTVSALLHSAAMVTLGVYLPLRLNIIQVDGVGLLADAQTVLALIGAIAFLWGAWRTVRTDELKNFLAHSTISNLGLAMVAATVFELYVPALLIIMLHAPAKALLFLASGDLVDRDLDTFGKMLKRGVAASLAVQTGLLGAATLATMPFAVTVAKARVLTGPLPTETLVVLIIGAVLSAIGYARWLTTWMRASQKEDGLPLSPSFGIHGLTILIPVALPAAVFIASSGARDVAGNPFTLGEWIPMISLLLLVFTIMLFYVKRGDPVQFYTGGGVPPVPNDDQMLLKLPVTSATLASWDKVVASLTLIVPLVLMVVLFVTGGGY